MKLPPLLDWYVDYFHSNPVVAVLLGIVVLLVALALLRTALKLFVWFLVLLAVAIVASYFFAGGEKTENALRKGANQAIEKANDVLGDEGEY